MSGRDPQTGGAGTGRGLTLAQALRASLGSALAFAALFGALILVGDLFWEREIFWTEKAITVAAGFVAFWLLIALKTKVKSR